MARTVVLAMILLAAVTVEGRSYSVSIGVRSAPIAVAPFAKATTVAASIGEAQLRRSFRIRRIEQNQGGLSDSFLSIQLLIHRGRRPLAADVVSSGAGGGGADPRGSPSPRRHHPHQASPLVSIPTRPPCRIPHRGQGLPPASTTSPSPSLSLNPLGTLVHLAYECRLALTDDGDDRQGHRR
ncbi:hypothetical protein DAI22_04g301500 [Oryza sativa Japonica Group]|nr:hypothetical protein DAI22_04g301500 [Oryza sativa Japonica Group]